MTDGLFGKSINRPREHHLGTFASSSVVFKCTLPVTSRFFLRNQMENRGFSCGNLMQILDIGKNGRAAMHSKRKPTNEGDIGFNAEYKAQNEWLKF